MYRQIAIKFHIFKDIKTKAQYYDTKDKQYPNIKLWRNPYNNVLDNLFKDLNKKNTKSLKAII